jgi:four helix bundle protein
MTPDDLKKRTRAFAIAVMDAVDGLPSNRKGRILGDQLFRAATSVGANYRAACKARSRAEFVAKIGVVEEEADECQYWLELLDDAALGDEAVMAELAREARELTAIMAASRKSARRG